MRAPVLGLIVALSTTPALAAGARVSMGSTGGVPDQQRNIGATVPAPNIASTIPAANIGVIGSLGDGSPGQEGIGASISGVSYPRAAGTPAAITGSSGARAQANASAVARSNPGALLVPGLALTGRDGERLGVISTLNRNAQGVVTTLNVQLSTGGTHVVPAGAVRSQGAGAISSYTLAQIERLPLAR